MSPHSTAQDPAADADYSGARVLFDTGGMPRSLAVPTRDGRSLRTSRLLSGRDGLAPTGEAATDHVVPRAWSFGPVRAHAAADGGWLLAAPFSRGGGSNLHLWTAPGTSAGARVPVSASIGEVVLAGTDQEAEKTPTWRVLRGAAVLAWDPDTYVARVLVEAEGRHRVRPAEDDRTVFADGTLLECEVRLAPSGAERSDPPRQTITGTFVGGGKDACVMTRGGEPWIAARIVETDSMPLVDTGYLLVHARDAAGRWQPVELPPLQISGCWSATRASTGELLVSSVRSLQQGTFEMVHARLLPDREAAWHVEVAPMTVPGADLQVQAVSWQRAPDVYPTPWTVDGTRRAFALHR